MLRNASNDALYDFDVGSLVDLDTRSALASGRLRVRRANGGFADGPRHWVYVFRGDLLWRSGVYTTAKDKTLSRCKDTRTAAAISRMTPSTRTGFAKRMSDMLSDKPRLAALDEVAGGRGDVRELRGVLYDPPRQIAPTRCFVLRIAASP